MFEHIPEEIKQTVIGIIGLLPTAVLARLLWHYRLFSIGKRRKFWSWDLLIELPMAVFCAIIGGGLAAYLQLDLTATNAVVGLASWIGPRGLEIIIMRVLERSSCAPKK